METYRPFSLYCDLGETKATVMVPADEKMQDNVYSFVEAPCAGCRRWSAEKLRRTEAEIRSECLTQFGSDADNITGIRDGRINQLEQSLVDRARFRGGEHKLVVAVCTPITRGDF